jgi:hypothetical protein
MRWRTSWTRAPYPWPPRLRPALRFKHASSGEICAVHTIGVRSPHDMKRTIWHTLKRSMAYTEITSYRKRSVLLNIYSGGFKIVLR